MPQDIYRVASHDYMAAPVRLVWLVWLVWGLSAFPAPFMGAAHACVRASSLSLVLLSPRYQTMLKLLDNGRNARKCLKLQACTINAIYTQLSLTRQSCTQLDLAGPS